MCQQCKQNGLHPEYESLLHNEWEEELIPEVAFNEEYGSSAAKPYATSASSWFSGLPSTVSSYVSKGWEMVRIKSAIAQGERNENVLTNLIFYARHPELGGKPLLQSQLNFSALSKEWITIRDTLVRPALSAPAKPSPTKPTPAKPSPGIPSTPANNQVLRSNMVILTLGEWSRWDFGNRTEDEQEMRNIIALYWKEGVGYEQTNLDTAWSAAFISWIVRKAGGGSNFKYSGAHTTYTYYAKQNRLQNNANPFKAYRISEIKPQAGDIVVKNQSGYNFTYDNLQPDKSGTHGDVVVKVNAGTIELAGGNKSNSTSGDRGVTVNKITLSLNSSGYIDKAGYFAIIRIGGAAPAEIKNEWEINPEYEYLLTGEDEYFLDQENIFSSIIDKIASLPSSIFALLKTGKEVLAVKSAIHNGLTDKNDLTNMVFFNRHPELEGKKLVTGQPNFNSLSQEWLHIRDKLVVPNLVSLPSKPSSPTPSGPSTPSGPTSPHMPPVEAPLKGVTGYTCPSGKKCWKGPKSADIVDADAPWNKPGNRSATNYLKVLDYLNVGEDEDSGPGNTIKKPSENPRYRQQKNAKGNVATYCNIYVHDATRAMWASIPHWVKSKSGKMYELNANDTVKWLLKNGRDIGWLQIDKDMLGWIASQNTAGKPMPAPNAYYTGNLSKAGAQVALSPGLNASLMGQPAYIAQLFANLGLPTVAVWNNPGGIGHVAMIRPEEPGKKGKIESGMFRPRSAQAGAKNFSSNALVFSGASLKKGNILFFVHE